MPLKWLKLSKYFAFCSKIYGTVNETLKSYLKLLYIVKWNATNQLHFQVSVLWTRHFSVTSNYQVELIRLINPVNHKRAKLKLEAKIAVRQNPRRSKRNEPEEEKWSVKSRWRHSVTMDEDVVTTQWNQLLCHHKQFFPPFFYYYWLICFHGFFFPDDPAHPPVLVSIGTFKSLFSASYRSFTGVLPDSNLLAIPGSHNIKYSNQHKILNTNTILNINTI